jgi:LysM repeat protein
MKNYERDSRIVVLFPIFALVFRAPPFGKWDAFPQLLGLRSGATLRRGNLWRDAMTRRWVFYLAINILVSAATMLGVLALWDRSRQPAPMIAPTLAATMTGLPSVTPSIAPSPTPHRYLVKSGDTLGSIAVQYGVSIETLMTMNPQIEDPNTLMPGMELILPTPEATVAPGANYPTITPGGDAVFPWPILVAVLSPGKLPEEALRITNAGASIQLQGWKIRAGTGEEFTFGDFHLVTAGAVMIHTAAGKDSPVDLYWGLTEPLWKAGAEVMLVDSAGNVRSVLVIPSD